MLTLVTQDVESALPLAWQHSGEFWTQTGIAIGQHPFVVFVCAVVPAAERVFVHLRSGRITHGQMALLEILVTLWRIMLCAVAAWLACTGHEWETLSARVGRVDAWPVALQLFGRYIGHHVRMELWQVVFFVLAFLLLGLILRWSVAALAQGSAWMRVENHRRAVLSGLLNLIYAPVAVIYLIEMARPIFR
jgi:hypothetical protein